MRSGTYCIVFLHAVLEALALVLREAVRDPLTNLLTARPFRRCLAGEAMRSDAGGGSFSIVYLDADGFKAINDRFGHAAGDRVLAELGALLERHLAAAEVAARNGGDEFCLLLSGTGKERAVERALRLCDAIRTHDFCVAARLTASIGVAVYPHDATTPGELLAIADAAMYASKRHGRDCVSFAVSPGAYASRRSEAARGLSRSPWRCRLISGESFGRF